jgi:serine/threonine-protein kinase
LWVFRDKVQALKQLEIAEKSLPNDVDVLLGKSEIIRTKGQWDEYINMLEKLVQRRPNDVSTLTNLAEAYWWTRRYRDGINAFNQAIALSPNNPWPYIYKAYGYWSWKGACKESRDAIKHIGNKHEWYLFSWFFQEVGEGNLQRALQLASDTTFGWGVDNKMWAIPRAMLTAFIYDYQNEPELAHTNYNTAIEILEKKVAQFPNNRRFHGALGIAFAGIGKKEEAIKEGLKAVDLLPISKDAIYGLGELNDLAIIYTMVGEFDLAFEKLDQLLSIPSWISPAWLGLDIRFAPLKSDPRYKKLIKKHAIDE